MLVEKESRWFIYIFSQFLLSRMIMMMMPPVQQLEAISSCSALFSQCMTSNVRHSSSKRKASSGRMEREKRESKIRKCSREERDQTEQNRTDRMNPLTWEGALSLSCLTLFCFRSWSSLRSLVLYSVTLVSLVSLVSLFLSCCIAL